MACRHDEASAADTASAVSDDRERRRFELDVTGTKAFIDYHRAGNVLVSHTRTFLRNFADAAAGDELCRLAPIDVLEETTAVKRVTSQCASAVAVMLALGAVLAGGMLGPGARAKGAVRAHADHAKTSNSVRTGRAKSTYAAVRPKLNLKHGVASAVATGGGSLVAAANRHHTGQHEAHPAVSLRSKRSGAGRADAHGAGSRRPKAAPRRRIALRLDDVFDPNFASGPQPLPYQQPQGFIEQSFGTDGEESTAGAVALPISSHWTVSAAFMRGTSNVFEYGLVPGGAGKPPRLDALPGSVNFTTLHAQVMYHPNSHFTAVFGVTSSRSNLMINPAAKPNPVNY